MLDLGTLGAGPDSVANAVNDRDQVIGVDVAANSPNGVGWLWQDGGKTALGNLGGASTNAFAINNRGQVVGKSQIGTGDVEHAFLWQGGRMRDLGTLPGDVSSEAFDINEQGQVVGFSCSEQQCHPAFWSNGTPVDVNTLLPATSGWRLFDAGAINERGQIVGGGINPNGEFHAYLLTPAP
jgi:probable HAF family extracellular repeat protein